MSICISQLAKCKKTIHLLLRMFYYIYVVRVRATCPLWPYKCNQLSAFICVFAISKLAATKQIYENNTSHKVTSLYIQYRCRSLDGFVCCTLKLPALCQLMVTKNVNMINRNATQNCEKLLLNVSFLSSFPHLFLV